MFIWHFPLSLSFTLLKFSRIYLKHSAYRIAFLSHIFEFHLISNLICFHRGRETSGHARRWSTKFHGNYMEQHRIDSYGSPNYSRCKTVLPDFHLPCHVISINRYFRETEVECKWARVKQACTPIIFFDDSKYYICVSKDIFNLTYNISCFSLKLFDSDDEIRREEKCDRFRSGSKKNLFANKLKARDSTADVFPRVSVSRVVKSKEDCKVSRNHVTFV